MKSAKRILWPVLVILVVAISGCPDSQFISSNSGNFAMQVTVNGGSGRYEMATFTMSPISMTPVDPQAAQALGFPVRLTASSVIVDLAMPTTTIGAVRVTGGRYQFDRINFITFRLQDNTIPLPPATKCVEAFSRVTSGSTPLTVTIDPPFEFTIPSDGGDRMVDMVIDGPGLIGLLEDEGFPFCDQFSAGPFVNPDSADLLQFITLEVQ